MSSRVELSRVAVLPHPPLLVPELVGDDADAALVRATALSYARDLAEHAPNWLVVGAGVGQVAPAGTFRGYGVDVRVTLAESADPAFADPDMPLVALVAGWLRGAVGASEATVRLVPEDLSPTDCAALSVSVDGQVGLLVLGDGSHRHGERAVGRPDDRAGAFDAAVAAALADVDVDALLALDQGVAADLGAVGRAPWQVLAGLVRRDGRTWRCARSTMLVPFGVAYHFATWEPA